MTSRKTKLLDMADKAAGEAAALGLSIGRDEHGLPTILALPGEGHNRASDDRLRLLIERIERLDEEKAGIADDIKDVYAEAKATGYDTRIIRQIIRLRKMDPNDRREFELLIDTYKSAVGME